MADDDDTSAGLTPETKPAVRRRASRRAGPPAESPAVDTDGRGAAETPGAAAIPGTTGAGGAVVITKAADAPAAPTGTAAVAPDTVGDVAAESAAAEAGGSGTTDGPARSGRGLVARIVAGVLVLVLAGAAVWLLIEKNAASDRDAQRNAFVQTARQTVLNLTTIKPETAKEDVERILAGASGDFRAEFDGREDPFVSVVVEAGVTTVGKILESGIESEDGDTAKVLVAARADVSTPDGMQNGPRDFRMRVTVTDDGTAMTASKVEFVP